MLPSITVIVTILALLVVLVVEKVIYKCDVKDAYLPPLVSYFIVFLPYFVGIFWALSGGKNETTIQLATWSLVCFFVSYIALTNVARHCR